jgi:hypothetical protein
VLTDTIEHGGALVVRVKEGLDGQPDIRAVEAADKDLWRLHAEAFNDLVPHRTCGGRGERQRGGATERLEEGSQAQVVGPEIVPPVADAMCLVDDEEGRLGRTQAFEGVVVRELLGGKKEEHAGLAFEIREDLIPFSLRERGVQLRRVDGVGVGQRFDLILLEGDER